MGYISSNMCRGTLSISVHPGNRMRRLRIHAVRVSENFRSIKQPSRGADIEACEGYWFGYLKLITGPTISLD